MQCSKSLLKGEQTYSAPLNWHSHCTSSFSRQLVCESSVANGASAWSLVRMVVGGAMRVDCLICDRWVFLSFSFPLFSPPPPPCFSSISICLSVLSTVSFFFRFHDTALRTAVRKCGWVAYTLFCRGFSYTTVCVLWSCLLPYLAVCLLVRHGHFC